MKKHGFRLSRVSFVKVVTAMLVFLLSLIILPYYTEGDQSLYRSAYEILPGLGLIEGYSVYATILGTRELGHYLLSWMASRFINKDLFIAVSNAVLAYLAMSLFVKWQSSITVAAFIVLTNSYFFFLYFTGERLKFAFIFLILSILYLTVGWSRKFCLFAISALVTHISVAIVYISASFKAFIQKTLRLFATGRISRKALFFIPLLLIPCFLLSNHISGKFLFYASRHEFAFSGLWRILAFLVLALWYSNRKRETFMMFIPLIAAVALVGGDRLNIFGYFAFLYHGLQYKKGMNFGVMATSLYFLYSSVVYLSNIFSSGMGF